MEKFEIKLTSDDEVLELEVREYPHHEGEKCKFEVYQHNKLLLAFEPHPYESLCLCKNPGNVDKKLVHLIADKIEAYQI